MNSQKLTQSMETKDKIELLSGADFWHTKAYPHLGLLSVRFSDGPCGLKVQPGLSVEKALPATAYPSPACVASSFNKYLAFEVAKAMAVEARALGVDVLLAPGVNIKRSPLCGRNFEYYSEDPFLSGEMGAKFIAGLRSGGVGAALKHFACNNREQGRHIADSVVDERALREIYLAPFERAVKEGPMAVMTAYNKINGVYAGENRRLIKDILRGEWGYGGLVLSDWGGIHDRVRSIKAGVDLEMPSSRGWFDGEILDALQSGGLDIKDIDASVGRINDLAGGCDSSVTAVVDEAHCYDVALKAALEGAVLLKNDGILPLKGRVVVYGRLAETPSFFGGGSSAVRPKFVKSALGGFNECDFDVEYCADYEGDALVNALALSRGSDACVVFAGGEQESEGFDRGGTQVAANERRLVAALLRGGAKVALVLCSGSVLDVRFAESASALVWSGFNGGAGGSAIARLLTGKDNFSGKLAETWAEISEYPQGFGQSKSSEYYSESIYVGYRWFDKTGRPVYFPFGHGLSYTTFEYSGMVVKKAGDYDFEVSFTVKNTGTRAGAEAVQLYVKYGAEGEFFAVRQLKGFEKVYLKPGEKKTVALGIDKRCFAYYNEMCGDYCVREGEYLLEAGSSSRDIRLASRVAIKGLKKPVRSGLVYDTLSRLPDQNDLQMLTGREDCPARAAKKGQFDMSSTLEEMCATFVGRLIKRKILKSFEGLPAAEKRMNEENVLWAPFSMVARMSDGILTKDKAEAVVCFANGKIFKGWKKWISRTK